MIKFNFLFVATLVFCFSLVAESCPDCPTNHDGVQHRNLITWSDYHCNEIRKLRDRVQALESQIELISADSSIEQKIDHNKQTIQEELQEIKQSIRGLTEVIQAQEKRIKEWERWR